MTIHCRGPIPAGDSARGGPFRPGSEPPLPGRGRFSSFAIRRPTLQPLSPREIQARVRAGASPEVVASETGWPLEKVSRYAQPPLGERAYIAEQARSVEISRSRGGSTLHQQVCAQISANPESDDVVWDSYRSSDGRWIVTAFHGGSELGVWIYETLGRSVHPQDDGARRMMGVGPTEPTSAATEATVTPPAIGSDIDHASAVVDDDQPEVEVEPKRPRLVSITSDPVAPVSPVAQAPASAQEPPSSPASSVDAGTESASDAPPKRAKRPKGKKGRASVPTWDEILFGATRDSD